MRKGIIAALGLLALAMPAEAQVATPPALTITAHNVTAEATDRTGTPSAASLPGDLIEYRLTFTNHTDGVVSDVVLNDPIPEGLVFVPGSVVGSREDLLIEYSLDSGGTWSTDPVVELETAGVTTTQPAPAEAYTHVRWTVTGAVNPGARVTARFRARVAGGANPGGDA